METDPPGHCIPLSRSFDKDRNVLGNAPLAPVNGCCDGCGHGDHHLAGGIPPPNILAPIESCKEGVGVDCEREDYVKGVVG